jgi:hypothetical protein
MLPLEPSFIDRETRLPLEPSFIKISPRLERRDLKGTLVPFVPFIIFKSSIVYIE